MGIDDVQLYQIDYFSPMKHNYQRIVNVIIENKREKKIVKYFTIMILVLNKKYCNNIYELYI